MTTKAAIIAKNLSVKYAENLILDRLNFEIIEGEFICVIGKSGTGKTTLLNTLASFLSYTGSLTVNGSIGFCFQKNSLFEWMTVEENIAFGLSTKDKKQETNQMLAKIGLEHLRNKYPKELSGGQVQRISMARAIIAKPAILILDEPFNSLDIFTRDIMIDWLSDFISEFKMTVIMVSHYMDEALIFSDRIFLLNKRGLSDEVIVSDKKPRSKEFRFSEDFQNKKQQLINLLN